MFESLFYQLRAAGIPVSLREYLTLMEAMEKGVCAFDVDGFYYLGRSALVKDERHLDRFDQVFGEVFKGLEHIEDGDPHDVPEDWLKKLAEKFLSEEEKEKIEALGGFEKILETLQQRLKEQEGRHQGGSKWIGTAGTSPFGAYGYNPEGVRIGQHESRHRRAVKVWDKRSFKNLSDDVELGTRNLKIALRKLRRFARSGAATELDLGGTIRSTAEKGGMLDLQMVPERHNSIKVLLFFDVGGSMDDHIQTCEELFSAARSEFKHMEYFYFHNCLYEHVWKDSRNRWRNKIPTMEVLRTYGHDYKVIIVGDATMGPYEIMYPGGSVEHWNEEAGDVWMRRLLDNYPKAVWINPQLSVVWDYHESIRIMNNLMEGRMYPLTLQGIDEAMRALL